MWFFLNLYLQQVLGASAFAAGAALHADDRTGRARHDRAGTPTSGAVRRQGADRQRTPPTGRWAGVARLHPTGRHLRRRRAPRLAARRSRHVAGVRPVARHRQSTRHLRRRPAWPPGWSAPATRSDPLSDSPCSRRSSTASPATTPPTVELTQGYSAAFIGAAILALLGAIITAIAMRKPRAAAFVSEESVSA